MTTMTEAPNEQDSAQRANLAEALLKKINERIVEPMPLVSSAPSTPAPSEIVLTTEQERVVVKVLGSHRLWCILGSAGTGKSVICHTIRERCKKAGLAAAMTSTTGLSSLGIGGNTIHSWSGAFAAAHDHELEAARIKKRNNKAVHNWQAADVLVIDEVSMLRPQFLDVLDALGRATRKRHEPFGGLRVILVGDFYQLQPVSQESEFVFEAECFDRFECLVLEQVHRQKDATLLRALNELKTGKIGSETDALFRQRQAADSGDLADGDQPTLLYARCALAEEANRVIVKNIEAEGYVFQAKDKSMRVSVNGKMVMPKHKRWTVPAELELRLGCEVICQVNLKLTDGIANGSRGVVVAFIATPPRGMSVPLSEFMAGLADLEEEMLQEYLSNFEDSASLVPVVRFSTLTGIVDWVICAKTFDQINYGQTSRTRVQLPLSLGYALTVHKAQGQSLPFVKVDVGSFWKTHGLLYVALSRATTLEGLFIEGYDRSKACCDKKVIEFYAGIEARKPDKDAEG